MLFLGKVNSGKTTKLVYEAIDNLTRGKKVLFISFEEKRETIYQNFLYRLYDKIALRVLRDNLNNNFEVIEGFHFDNSKELVNEISKKNFDYICLDNPFHFFRKESEDNITLKEFYSGKYFDSKIKELIEIFNIPLTYTLSSHN